MFTGRVVEPGEAEFLPEDIDGAIALAEEERDTCGACGMPKAICRDPHYQFGLDAEESVCWPSYRLAQHRTVMESKGYDDATKASVQVSARFRPDVDVDWTAGLDLPEIGAEKEHGRGDSESG